jgi:hypothetical protein
MCDSKHERIDFISSYCDQWCDRCAFTQRCSAYAVQVAITMCDGDFEEAIALAVGPPPPLDEAEARRRMEFLDRLNEAYSDRSNDHELAQAAIDAERRRVRVERSPIATMSLLLAERAAHWLDEHREQLLKTAGPRVADALQIASWDRGLIPAKLHRALGGRDDAQYDDWDREDPIQNDWNGSAKVALILLARSADAWDTLAEATDDPQVPVLADQLRQLRQDVDQEFPDAWRFIRPGFDDGGDNSGSREE